MEVKLMDNKLGYEILDDGKQVGKIVWELNGDTMVMDGTYVDESLRGQNMGEKLLDHAATFAKENNYRMKAVCPYVVKMFERSTKYDDVKTS